MFRATGGRRIGLVTPYTDDVQAKIIANWGASGFICVAERHLGIADNNLGVLDPRALNPRNRLRYLLDTVADCRLNALI